MNYYRMLSRGSLLWALGELNKNQFKTTPQALAEVHTKIEHGKNDDDKHDDKDQGKGDDQDKK